MDALDNIIDDFNWENFREISNEISNVNENALMEDLMKIPAIYTQWHQLQARARRKYEDKSRELTRLSAELGRECQAIYTDKGKKATARDMEYYIDSNEEYNSLCRAASELKEIYEMVRAVVQAVSFKKDVLIQININNREETKLYN
jgi:uncharacterized membrane protein YccC